MLPLIALVAPIVVAFLYPSLQSYNAIRSISLPKKQNSDITGRIMLITAHPDDEAMFFSPTITALTHHASVHNDLELYTVCISTGDMDGSSAERSAELQRSLDVLNVSRSRRWILDEPELKDNISSTWDAAAIARAVGPIVYENKITTILTFDRQGVSSHLNHISIPGGITHLLSSKDKKSADPPRLFTLVSVPLHLKYIGPLGPVLTKVDLVVSQAFLALTSKLASYILMTMDMPPDTALPNEAPVFVFVSGWNDWWTGFSAMSEHRSQLLWYRWAYLLTSRYMWVNEWVEVSL